jgi:hypothetical protein
MADHTNIIYPGFSGKAPLAGRVQRLETGAQRIQGNNLRFSNGIYTRIPKNTLNTSQGINLTSSAVIKKGGVSVSGNISGFAYTSTATSISWYWDGTNGSHVIVIIRADGSRFTVPTSGSPLTVTGLAASTTYYFLPFWNVDNVCNIGWVQGTVGTPQVAFVVGDTTDAVNTQRYIMQQTLQSNEGLTAGFMTAATVAVGGGTGGGGGGGGGGSGRCVMAGTIIEPLGDHEYSVNVRGNNEWVYLKAENGKELWCTKDHPLYEVSRGKIEADYLTDGDIVITDTGEQKLVQVTWATRKCSLWEVVMPKGHLFWANGFLSHNKNNYS